MKGKHFFCSRFIVIGRFSYILLFSFLEVLYFESSFGVFSEDFLWPRKEPETHLATHR